jgi:hypothetical protein
MQTACINVWSVISVLLGSFELDNVSLVPYIPRHHKVYRTNRRFEQYAMVSYSNQLVVLLNVFLAQYYSRTAFLGYSSICETIDGSRFEASLEVVCRLGVHRDLYDRRAEGVTLRRLTSHCCHCQAAGNSLPETLQD